MFTEQIAIFQEGMSVRLTDTNFPGAHLCVHRTETDFPGAPILSIEQVPIFQEHLFSYRTDTDFPGALIFWLPSRQRFSRKLFSNINEQIGSFQKGTPLRTDILALGLGGCFRSYKP